MCHILYRDLAYQLVHQRHHRRTNTQDHHPLTIHGSFENRTDRPRRATVLNFVKDGVCSTSDEPLLQGVPPIPEGMPLSGQFFPLLRNSADGPNDLG